MPLEDRVELDVDDALRRIDSIEEALNGAATRFSVALAEALDVLSTVQIGDADASSVTTALDAAVEAADLEPALDADATGVTASIDDAVNAADTVATIEANADPVASAIDEAVAAADTSVEIDADTSAAEAAIEDLGATATQVDSSTDFGGLTGGLDGLSAAAGAATGNLSGLEGAVSNLPGPAKAASAGLAAVVGVSGELFHQALESETAQLRFNRALGDVASTVATIHIEGFANNLEDLAEKTGNSDEAMKLAAARLGDLGKSAGASSGEIAGAAENILLLATHLSVTNPTLGDAGEIADRLTAALARGGRALTPYGINLDTAAIKARAVADAGGDASAETDRFALAAAGAALATEKLGTNLQTGIVEGAKSTEIQLRSVKEQFGNTLEALGRPLLKPVIDAAQEAEPILVDLATVFGELGGELAPILVDALKILAPAFHSFADAAHLVLTPLRLIGSAIDLIPGHAKSASEQTKSSFDDMTTSVVQNLTDIAAAKLPSEQLDDIDRLGIGVGRLGELASQGKAGLNEFLTTMERGGEITSSVADALRKNGGDVEDLISHHKRLGVTQAELNDSNLGLARTFGATAEEEQKQAKAALENIASNEELTTSQRNIAREALNATGAHVDYVAAVGRIKGTSDDAKGGVDGLTTALGDQEQQAGQTEDSLKTLLDAVLGFADSTLAADNANARFQQSLQDVVDKTTALAKAQAEHGKSSAEAAAAQADLDQATRSAVDSANAAAHAQVQLAIDTGTVAGGTEHAAEQWGVYRQSLVDAANKAGPGSPVQVALLSLIGRLDATAAAGQLNLQIDADTAQAERNLASLQRKLDRLNTHPLVGVTVGGASMAGGVTTTGREGHLHMFGEAGPELVFIGPNTTAQTLTAGQTAGNSQPTSQGPSVGVNIEQLNVNEVANDPQATAFAVSAIIGAKATR